MLAVGKQVLGDLDDRTLRMMTGLAGGIGLTTKDVCGAFSAAVMILGAQYGRTKASQDDRCCQYLVKEFRDRFETRLGSVYCYQLRAEDYGSQGKEPCAVLVERAVAELLALIGS